MNLVIALLALIIVAAIVAVGVWAMMNLAASSLDVNDFGETDVSAWAPPTAEELDELARDACPHCRGSGLRDSGGMQPWGDPILVQCDCPASRFAAGTLPKTPSPPRAGKTC